MMKKVILVTGGSRGIGKAVCKAFAEKENVIIINYSKSDEEAEKAAHEISLSGALAETEKADVSNFSEVKKMVDSVVKRHGRIDLLVNNAGIARDGFVMLMSEKDWRDVIETNLTGVFNCSKAVTGHMMAERSGVIINISSLSGITGLAGQVNYSAAKGGVIAFTKALAKELSPFGIRVNAVAPGMIETDMVDSLNEKTRDYFLENIPLKRFGRPEEVAGAVRFLASPEAGYITGETISITGGL